MKFLQGFLVFAKPIRKTVTEKPNNFRFLNNSSITTSELSLASSCALNKSKSDKKIRTLLSSVKNLLGSQRVYASDSSNDNESSEDVCSKREEFKKNTDLLNTKRQGVVAVLEAQRFVCQCLEAQGLSNDYASLMADALVVADYSGHPAMGMQYLPSLMRDITRKTIDCSASPELLKETNAIAWVDGQKAPGAVVANYCMDMAIVKAKNAGIGLVSVKRSNNIGLTWWYACQATQEKLLGFCMSSTEPVMVPHGGTQTILGENPISFGARTGNDMLLFDVPMTMLSMVDIAARRDACEALPYNSALDDNKNVTTDVAKALKAKCLKPMGGYKGYGLAAMVEILCGVLSGASGSKTSKSFDYSQIFIAIDPKLFAKDFENRLKDFNQILRCTKARDPKKPVLLPGDRETKHMSMVDEAGGIEYTNQQLTLCYELAKRLSILPMNLNYY